MEIINFLFNFYLKNDYPSLAFSFGLFKILKRTSRRLEQNGMSSKLNYIL